jgi:hypothetical protein
VTPEQKARQKIDQQLDQCGWKVQDYRQMNISAGRGVAVREFPLSTGEAVGLPALIGWVVMLKTILEWLGIKK